MWEFEEFKEFDEFMAFRGRIETKALIGF